VYDAIGTLLTLTGHIVELSALEITPQFKVTDYVLAFELKVVDEDDFFETAGHLFLIRHSEIESQNDSSTFTVARLRVKDCFEFHPQDMKTLDLRYKITDLDLEYQLRTKLRLETLSTKKPEFFEVGPLPDNNPSSSP